MSKIAYMGVGAVDPIARTKRVFWRPVTASTVIKVGQPVCYNSDATVDAKERSSAPHSNHLGGSGATSYAEGSQCYTGRMFIVEEPRTANLHAFAGIVKSLGPKAGADGDMLEIFTPVEGAIVPVYTDENCTLDVTILGIRNGEADVTYPGRAIGVAAETKDRSGTDGIVWMKFKSFLYDNQSSALAIDDEANGSDVIVNKINVTTPQTSGRFTAFEVKAAVTSTGSSQSGGCGFGLAIYSQVDISGVLSGNQNAGVSFWTNLNAGADLTSQYFALEVGIRESGADLSSCGFLVPLCLRMEIDGTEGPAANRQFMMYLRSDGTGDQPDGLFAYHDAESIKLAAKSSAAVSHTIPIYQEDTDTTYYIMVSDTA